MVKKKVSLGSSPDLGDAAGQPGEGAISPGARAAAVDILELFFNTGIILHEVSAPNAGRLPDVVSSFVVMGGAAGGSVRRAEAGEEPDVEISAVDHLSELAALWFPVPYQLSCPFAVQVFLAQTAGGSVRAVMAVDTFELTGSQGRH